MVSKSDARTLLEKFFGGDEGADAVMHADIEAAILKNELQKRLKWWEYRWALQDARGAAHPEKVLYARLARELTRQEMERVHDRIHTGIREYQNTLRARKKTPR